MVIEVKKPQEKRPPQPLPNPDPLITGSPVIGTPTLGQVHRLGPPPHELHAEPLVVSTPDIAPQFKPRKQPPVTKEEVPPGKKKRVRQQGVILDRLLLELRQQELLSDSPTKVLHQIDKRWPREGNIRLPSLRTVGRRLGHGKG
jgi:hypothetical protein